MLPYLVLTAKFVATWFIVAAAVSLANLVLQFTLGTLLQRNNSTTIIYCILVAPVFLYAYTAVGATFHCLISSYIDAGSKPWIVYTLAIITLSIMGDASSKDLKKQGRETHFPSDFASIQERRIAYRFIASFAAISCRFACLLSFIVFFFTSDFYIDLYFGLPIWYANLFL